MDATVASACLRCGGHDGVVFKTSISTQHFRSFGTDRTLASDGAMAVTCVELSFLPDSKSHPAKVLEEIYNIHPYEDPVTAVQAYVRALYKSGTDGDNPNRVRKDDGVEWYWPAEE